MTLIPCPDCGAQVSDAAPTCIHCGRPLQLPAHGPGPPVTIEKTGKEWKRLMGVGGLAAILGVILLAGGSGGFGPLLMLGGFALFVVARVGAWWHHG